MRNYLVLFVFVMSASISAFASDTITMVLHKAAPENHAIFKGNIWMAFDWYGGVIEYDVSSKELIPHNSGLGFKTITDIAVFNGNLYITSKVEGIFMYDSIGDQWKNCTPFGIHKDSNFFALEADAGILVASGCQGYLYYTENGIHWNKVSTNFESCITAICFINDSWWFGGDNSTMFKYDKTFNTKQDINNLPIRGRAYWGFWNIEKFQDNIYAINDEESIIVSKDSGTTWQTITKEKPWINAGKFYPIDDRLYIYEYSSGLYLLNDKHEFQAVFTDLIKEPKEREYLRVIIEHNGIQIFCSSERIIVIH